jgi:hypothetical protein
MERSKLQRENIERIRNISWAFNKDRDADKPPSKVTDENKHKHKCMKAVEEHQWKLEHKEDAELGWL